MKSNNNKHQFELFEKNTSKQVIENELVTS